MRGKLRGRCVGGAWEMSRVDSEIECDVRSHAVKCTCGQRSPKTMKTNPKRVSTLPIFGNTVRIHWTSTGMPGTRLSARSGLSARKARSTE